LGFLLQKVKTLRPHGAQGFSFSSIRKTEWAGEPTLFPFGSDLGIHFVVLSSSFQPGAPRGRAPMLKASCRTHQPALTPLDSLDRLLLLDPTAFPLGEIVIMATQDWLDVLLKIFSELADFLFNVFSCFGLRHSAFTYLSKKSSIRRCPLFHEKCADLFCSNLLCKSTPYGYSVGCLHKPHNPASVNHVQKYGKRILYGVISIVRRLSSRTLRFR